MVWSLKKKSFSIGVSSILLCLGAFASICQANTLDSMQEEELAPNRKTTHRKKTDNETNENKPGGFCTLHRLNDLTSKLGTTKYLVPFLLCIAENEGWSPDLIKAYEFPAENNYLVENRDALLDHFYQLTGTLYKTYVKELGKDRLGLRAYMSRHPYHILKIAFPHKTWNPLGFKTMYPGGWHDKNVVLELLLDIGNKEGWETPEDYQKKLTKNKLLKHGASGLFSNTSVFGTTMSSFKETYLPELFELLKKQEPYKPPFFVPNGAHKCWLRTMRKKETNDLNKQNETTETIGLKAPGNYVDDFPCPHNVQTNGFWLEEANQKALGHYLAYKRKWKTKEECLKDFVTDYPLPYNLLLNSWSSRLLLEFSNSSYGESQFSPLRKAQLALCAIFDD